MLKKEMLPPNCPRLFERSPGNFTYEIGKPWENPFISIHLGGDSPHMLTTDGTSEETIFDFMCVMSADFYACWTLVAHECDQQKTENAQDFILLQQRKSHATKKATFWLNAAKARFKPKENPRC